MKISNVNRQKNKTNHNEQRIQKYFTFSFSELTEWSWRKGEKTLQTFPRQGCHRSTTITLPTASACLDQLTELADCRLLFDQGDDLWFTFRADGFQPAVSTLLEIFSLTV